MSRDQKGDHAAEKQKISRYCTPRLHVYGDLTSLTKGGTAGSPEGGTSSMSKKP